MVVAEALDTIGALYRVERRISYKGLEGEAKLQVRCPTQPNGLGPQSSAGQGPEARCRTAGVLERSGRTHRHLGRKNRLFGWCEDGARHVRVIQSLMTTC